MAESPNSAAGAQAPPLDHLALILAVGSGEIVSFEAADSAGLRREFSPRDKIELAKAWREGTVEDLIERSFEAGIATVLGDGEGADDDGETEDEAAFRRVLLKPLIERAGAAKALGRVALRRAIVRSLIRDAVARTSPSRMRRRSPPKT